MSCRILSYLFKQAKVLIETRDGEEKKTVLIIDGVHLQLKLAGELESLFRLHDKRVVPTAVRVV